MIQLLIQFFLFLFGKVLLSPFTARRLDASLTKHIALGSCLVVANHKRSLDPFIIGAAMPIRVALKLLPMGLMMHNFFYDSPIRPLAWLTGCFPAKNPHGKHLLFGVEGSAALLRHGFSIFIFPEGTRVRHQQRGPARPGVIRIHQAAPDVPMLLCHITYHAGWSALFSGRLRTVSYKLVNNPQYDDPEKLMDDIFAL